MLKVKVKMLKNGVCNPTQRLGDRIEYKKGDIIEVADYLVDGMVDAGACSLELEKQEPQEPREPVFDIKKANKEQLQAKAAELGLDVEGNKADIIARIEEALNPSAPDGGDDDGVDLDDLDRKGLIAFIDEYGLDIDVSDKVGDDELRKIIAEKATDEPNSENKAIDAAPENK